MNMPTRRGRRGPERKEFQQLYSWDQVPPIVDQGFICTMFGITRNTFKKYESEGTIARIPDFPPRIVRYHKADVMQMLDIHLDKTDCWNQVPLVADQTYVRGLLGVSYGTFVEKFEKEGKIARIPGLSVARYRKADVMRMVGLDPDHAA